MTATGDNFTRVHSDSVRHTSDCKKNSPTRRCNSQRFRHVFRQPVPEKTSTTRCKASCWRQPIEIRQHLPGWRKSYTGSSECSYKGPSSKMAPNGSAATALVRDLRVTQVVPVVVPLLRRSRRLLVEHLRRCDEGAGPPRSAANEVGQSRAQCSGDCKEKTAVVRPLPMTTRNFDANRGATSCQFVACSPSACNRTIGSAVASPENWQTTRTPAVQQDRCAVQLGWPYR